MSYFHNDNVNTKCIKHTIIRCQSCSHAQSLKNHITQLSERLPYADGQAYYNDRNKIEQLQDQLRKHLKG